MVLAGRPQGGTKQSTFLYRESTKSYNKNEMLFVGERSVSFENGWTNLVYFYLNVRKF